MMQIEQLVLYSKRGEVRPLEFRVGELNVITGDSGTGKSALTNIFRFCLGGSRPDVPLGPISQTVAWYGLIVRIGDVRLFLGRPAPDGSSETTLAMLLVNPVAPPAFGDLVANTTSDEMREYLAGMIGIEENLNVPAIGNTRQPLAASFVHSLYYAFQGQGELANPRVLFHRQDEEWQKQTIRDTLPYFLGVQGLEQLRQRRRLTEQRRDLKRAEQRLERARNESLDVLDRVRGLLTEARDAGLQVPDDEEATTSELRAVLASLVNTPIESSPAVDMSGQFEQVRAELAEQRQRAREIVEELQGLEGFSEVAASYEGELTEQRARLVSIGLVAVEGQDAECPVCGADLHGAAEEHQTVTDWLAGVSRRLELAARDRPRVEKARSTLLDERTSVLERIEELNGLIASLVDTNDMVARERQRVNVQSYIRGKIAEYLSASDVVGADDFAELERIVDGLRASVAELEASLDPEAIRSRVESAVARVNREVGQIAGELGLEHAEEGVRLDVNRLTVVADTPEGPAYLDAGQIGSGLNWVGYHLAVYLGLHRFFITAGRPVPRFLLLDQPSQAFFPPDRASGGDLEELDDTDRAHTRALYRLLYDEVQRQSGALQVIALDHADFEDDWFQDSVVHRWRDGDALIPAAWLEDRESDGAGDDAARDDIVDGGEDGIPGVDSGGE